MSILFLFVDGVGIGPSHPGRNPLTAGRLSLLNNFSDREREEPLPFQGHCVPLDATMGVDGTPQSATGQTALLTGLNAARVNGTHLTGFPNRRLRKLLRDHSVLKRLRQRGRRVLFANAYRPISFLLPPPVLRRRSSATTVATFASGVPFRTVWEIPIGEALYHDFTNEGLSREGYDLPIRSPEEAGETLARIVMRNDFVMYEYFKTDTAGHGQNWDKCIALTEQYDRFLHAVLKNLDLTQSTVILASDHGNLEDISTPTHTMNPAMGLVFGRRAEEVAVHLRSVTDVTGVILSLDSHDNRDPSADAEEGP